MNGADLIFHNGPVFLGAGHPRTDAVAVRAGRIVALGAADCRDLAGPGTETVDLRGRLLLPGFQDAHVHPIQGGLELAACDLSDERTAAGYLALIRSYADAHPDIEWITGAGWAMEAFPGGTPTRQLLDQVVGDRPVYLPNRDHHGAWVNTTALHRAGITANTPDPADGRIERDADGEPTGMLQEGAAELVARHVPKPTDDDLRSALLVAQARLHGFGLTAWQDALVGAGLGMADTLAVYVAAAGAGQLTARVRGALWWQRDGGLEQLAQLAHRRESATVGRFRADTVKMMLDGVAENHTAAMLEPYLDGCGGPGCHHDDPAHTLDTSGLDFIDPTELGEFVAALDADGFQVHFHSLGDRAVRNALNAVAVARARNGAAGPRHHLAHLQVVHPDDVARFGKLEVAANMQPYWASHEPQMDELTIPYLGTRRAGWQYPFGDLARAGAHLAAGSDWPVTTVDPLQGVHVAVNRRQPEVDGPAFLPDQCLDLAAALDAYTAGSAWVNGTEADTGTIRIGAYADLVVLDRDLFTQPADELADAHVVLTYVEGERVYTAADA